ncbi:MAG: hypothetical protein ACREVN_09190, partial [Gammaproteobacteria bacterium]
FVTSLSLAFLGARPEEPRSLLNEAVTTEEPAERSVAPEPGAEEELPALPEPGAEEELQALPEPGTNREASGDEAETTPQPDAGRGNETGR